MLARVFTKSLCYDPAAQGVRYKRGGNTLVVHPPAYSLPATAIRFTARRSLECSSYGDASPSQELVFAKLAVSVSEPLPLPASSSHGHQFQYLIFGLGLDFLDGSKAIPGGAKRERQENLACAPQPSNGPITLTQSPRQGGSRKISGEECGVTNSAI